MGLDVSTLFLVAQDPGGKGSHDPEMLSFSRAWAKQVQHCSGAACVKTFSSYATFLDTLKSYDHIGKLAILTHAGTDNLGIPDGVNTLVLKSLNEIAADLGNDAPVADNLEFLGCMAGRDVTGLWTAGAKFQVQSGVAYTWLHAFQPLNVPIDPGDTGDSVRERIGEDAYRYLLEDTDLDALATQTGKSVQIWLEWYRMVLEDAWTPFEKADAIQHRKEFLLRSRAQHIQILVEGDAQPLRDKIRNQRHHPDFLKVEVVLP